MASFPKIERTVVQPRAVKPSQAGDSVAIAKKRLFKDLKMFKETSPPGVSGAPREGDIMTWDCVVCGLRDTIFESKIFEVTLKFSADYPFQAPSVKFLTKMFHPSISPDGTLPLKIWSSALDVTSILTNIQCLLSGPQLPSSSDF